MGLGAVVLTDYRNNDVDFPYPWFKSAGALMIPNPMVHYDKKAKTEQLSKIGAVWKPFQFQVAFFYLFILIFTDLLI